MNKVVTSFLVSTLCLSTLINAAQPTVEVVAAVPAAATTIIEHAPKTSHVPWHKHGIFWPHDNKRFPIWRHVITGTVLWGLVYYLEKNFLLTPSAGAADATDTIITLLGDQLQNVADQLSIDLNTIKIFVSPITSSDQLFFSPKTIAIQEQLFNVLTTDELLFAITHQLTLIKNGSTLMKLPVNYATLIASFYAVKGMRDWGNSYLDKNGATESSITRKIINNGPACYLAWFVIDNLINAYYDRHLILNADKQAAELLGYDVALAYLEKVQSVEANLISTPSAFVQTLKMNHCPSAMERISNLTNAQKGSKYIYLKYEY